MEGLRFGNAFLNVTMSLFDVSINVQLIPLSVDTAISVDMLTNLPCGNFISVCWVTVACISFPLFTIFDGSSDNRIPIAIYSIKGIPPHHKPLQKKN